MNFRRVVSYGEGGIGGERMRVKALDGYVLFYSFKVILKQIKNCFALLVCLCHYINSILFYI